jgi:hypothetical protein
MNGRIEPNIDSCLSSLRQKLCTDIIAANAGPVFMRTEEFVDLLEQLPPRPAVLVNDKCFHTAPGGFNCRRKSRRTGADNGKIKLILWISAHR